MWKPLAIEGDLLNNVDELLGVEVWEEKSQPTVGTKNDKITLKRKNSNISELNNSTKKIKHDSEDSEKKKPRVKKGKAERNKLKRKNGINVSENKQTSHKKVKNEGKADGTIASKNKKRKSKKLKMKKNVKNENAAQESDEVGRFVKSASQNKDHNSEEELLKEMNAWKIHGVRTELLMALHEKRYFTPTKIQEKCLHGAATSKTSDIVGAAETGSGKTYAFGIPVVQQIMETRETSGGYVSGQNKELYALIVTPTRELAVQVKDHLIQLCKFTDIRIALVVGGLAIEKQERILNRNPEIVVGTPGRIWQLFNERHPHILKLSGVGMLVIDEADRMLEQKHFAELGELLDKMNIDPVIRNKRRNFVFSATLTVVHDLPGYQKGKKMKQAKKLNELLAQIGVKKQLVYDLTEEKLTPASLSEWKIECDFAEKDYYLVYFLRQNRGRCIIFCNSIGCVRRLANILNIVQHRPLPLHANMEQKQRLRNLEKFRDDENGILLATDVAARGLDISRVGHVVHYQVPRTAESYIHRSGRTARGANAGASLLLISIEERSMYNKLMKTLRRDNGLDDFDFCIDELNHVKKIVHVARDIDQTTLAVKRSNSSEKWYTKAIEEMDLIVDEDELPSKASENAMAKLKKDLSFKEAELKRLLNAPFLPRGFSGKFPDLNTGIGLKKKSKA